MDNIGAADPVNPYTVISLSLLDGSVYRFRFGTINMYGWEEKEQI